MMENENGKAETTEANRRRFKKHEHLRLHNIKAAKVNYLIGFFVQLLFSGLTDRRTS